MPGYPFWRKHIAQHDKVMRFSHKAPGAEHESRRHISDASAAHTVVVDELHCAGKVAEALQEPKSKLRGENNLVHVLLLVKPKLSVL
jgi:hypothetical protein